VFSNVLFIVNELCGPHDINTIGQHYGLKMPIYLVTPQELISESEQNHSSSVCLSNVLFIENELCGLLPHNLAPTAKPSQGIKTSGTWWTNAKYKDCCKINENAAIYIERERPVPNVKIVAR